MDKNVANVLAELRQDHKNMSLLLNLLEVESNRPLRRAKRCLASD